MRKIILMYMFLLAVFMIASASVNGELIAYYEFESDARDRSGFGLNADGRFVDVARISTDSAVGNGSLKLGGYSDYVDLGRYSKFDITDQITVSAWIKVQFYAEYCEPFVTKGDSSWRLQRRGQGPYVEFSCTGLFIEPDEKGAYGLYSKTEIDDGQWHHIVGVYDGEKISIYIDGKLDASKAARGKIALNDCPVYIGENYENMGRGFCGWIDSVAIYNHALTQEDITQLYNKKIPEQTQRIYDVIKKATLLINDNEGQKAKKYLEQEIRSLEKIVQQDLNNGLFDSRLYAELFVLSAKAQELAGSDEHLLVQAYLKSLGYDLRLTDMADCYMWLLKNLTAEELKEYAGQRDIFENINQSRAVQVAEYFLIHDNYNDFHLFFETFFDDKYRPAQFGPSVRDALAANEQWLERFNNTFKIKPYWLELTKFEEGKKEFEAGRYQRAAVLLEDFLKDYKDSAWGLDKDALLLAGQCYVQLGKTENAYDNFMQLIFEYPDSSQADEASLILGYTYMINNRFDLAKIVFGVLIDNSMRSDYICKANRYLERINLLGQ